MMRAAEHMRDRQVWALMVLRIRTTAGTGRCGPITTTRQRRVIKYRPAPHAGHPVVKTSGWVLHRDGTKWLPQVPSAGLRAAQQITGKNEPQARPEILDQHRLVGSFKPPR